MAKQEVENNIVVTEQGGTCDKEGKTKKEQMGASVSNLVVNDRKDSKGVGLAVEKIFDGVAIFSIATIVISIMIWLWASTLSGIKSFNALANLYIVLAVVVITNALWMKGREGKSVRQLAVITGIIAGLLLVSLLTLFSAPDVFYSSGIIGMILAFIIVFGPLLVTILNAILVLMYITGRMRRKGSEFGAMLVWTVVFVVLIVAACLFVGLIM